jgi:hypothetical protein
MSDPYASWTLADLAKYAAELEAAIREIDPKADILPENQPPFV